jgi:hypothetical protein
MVLSIIISSFVLLLFKEVLSHLLITCLVEGYLASLHDFVSLMIKHSIGSRVVSISKENPITRSSLKLVEFSLLMNTTLAAKNSEMTHLGCLTMHKLITGLPLESSQYNPIGDMTGRIDRLSPIPPRSPVLIEHRPSYLTKSPIFPFHDSILRGHKRGRILMFKT